MNQVLIEKRLFAGHRAMFLNFFSFCRFDPRLPETFQSWGMTLETLEECHLRFAQHLKEQLELKQRQQSSQTPQLFAGGQKVSLLLQELLCIFESPLKSLSIIFRYFLLALSECVLGRRNPVDFSTNSLYLFYSNQSLLIMCRFFLFNFYNSLFPVKAQKLYI